MIRNEFLLGGGNSKIFYVDPWGNDPIWRASFPNGLVQSPPSLVLFQIFVPFEGEIIFCHQKIEKTPAIIANQVTEQKKRTLSLLKVDAWV